MYKRQYKRGGMPRQNMSPFDRETRGGAGLLLAHEDGCAGDGGVGGAAGVSVLGQALQPIPNRLRAAETPATPHTIGSLEGEGADGCAYWLIGNCIDN